MRTPTACGIGIVIVLAILNGIAWQVRTLKTGQTVGGNSPRLRAHRSP